MKIVVNNIKIPVEKYNRAECISSISKALQLGIEEFEIFEILSKSLDMRNGKQFYYKMSFAITVSSIFENVHNYDLYLEANTESATKSQNNIPRSVANVTKPIIVGFGPAGMFAALEYIEHDIKPIIFERGKKIEERAIDVNNFVKNRVLNSESNIQFGEGGAGSFSDGKLFSRMNKNTIYVKKVLEMFVRFGAPASIIYSEKPHLGTDLLCKIVKNIRNYILERGGSINYSSKMTDLIIEKEQICGVVVNNKSEHISKTVFIATGHSARDVFQIFSKKSLFLQPKPVSVGVRIEHSVKTINLIRYGLKYQNFDRIGAATYSFNYTNKHEKSGAYTFCMCPGGEVVNASSEDGLLVLNGMSYSTRSSHFSNSAIVVPCYPKDFLDETPFGGINFQMDIERKAYTFGGQNWSAPAQNLTDFMKGSLSEKIHSTSFKMGLQSANLHKVLPKFICKRLMDAFTQWRDLCPLFVSEEAVLMGVETRTSSPVKSLRNKQYEAINIKGLYIIGEGSGYTGGIVSSAVDGMKSVKAQLIL